MALHAGRPRPHPSFHCACILHRRIGIIWSRRGRGSLSRRALAGRWAGCGPAGPAPPPAGGPGRHGARWHACRAGAAGGGPRPLAVAAAVAARRRPRAHPPRCLRPPLAACRSFEPCLSTAPITSGRRRASPTCVRRPGRLGRGRRLSATHRVAAAADLLPVVCRQPRQLRMEPP